MRIALVQVASPDHEPKLARIARVEAMLRDHSGADMYVLPELWSPGYFDFDRYEQLAEPLDGPTVEMGQRVATELAVTVHLGSIIERDREGRLHNTTVVIGPDGAITQVYRKIHVFGYQSLEAQLLTPGTTLSIVPSPLGQLASITCYDLRFPGLWLEIGARGADAVAIPAAWPAARREHWRTLARARAIEHQVFVVAVNACGVQRGVALGGASLLVDPWGEVVAECSETDEDVQVVDVDPSLVAQVRREFPVIGDRLDPGAYRALGA